MTPLRQPSTVPVMIVCSLVSFLQASSQQDQTYCNATSHGESASITCYFDKDITKIRPIVVIIERYYLDNKNGKHEEILICTWTTEAENNCEIKTGYEMKGADSSALYLSIAKVTAHNAGFYACKMMHRDAQPASPNTCQLLVEGTAPDQQTTARDNLHKNEKETAPQTNLIEFSETTELPVLEGSGLLGLIGAVGAVVTAIALIAAVLLIYYRRYRRRHARAVADKKDRHAEDRISDHEEESTSCDKLRHCSRASDGDAAASKVNGSNNSGLVKDRIEKFGGSTSARSETNKPMVKNSENAHIEKNFIGSGKKAMKPKATNNDKPIYTKQLKQPLLGNENQDKKDLPLKPSRSSSQQNKPQGGGETTEKPSSSTNENPDNTAPVHLADSPEEFVEIFMEVKTNLKPVPESEAPEAKTGGASASQTKKCSPEVIEFENSIKLQRERLACVNAEKSSKEKMVSEAKEYEKELAACRERLKSSQSSQEGKELHSPSVHGAKPVPEKRERLISQENCHSARSGPSPSEDKEPEKEKEAEITRLMAGLRPKDNHQLLPESVEESVRM